MNNNDHLENNHLREDDRMKYRTYELWCKYIEAWEKGRDQVELVEEEWHNAFQEYKKSFESIKNRFSKKVLAIHSVYDDFHDFHIKEFRIIHKDYRYKNPISINLIITDEENTWKITYKCIKKISIHYEQDDAMKGTYWEERCGFDDWGYDEFSAVDEDTLSHEILFASGASIFIHFKNKNIFISKVK